MFCLSSHPIGAEEKHPETPLLAQAAEWVEDEPLYCPSEFWNSRDSPDSQSGNVSSQTHSSSPALTSEEDLHGTILFVSFFPGFLSLSSLPLWADVSSGCCFYPKGPFHRYFSVILFLTLFLQIVRNLHMHQEREGTGICQRADRWTLPLIPNV